VTITADGEIIPETPAEIMAHGWEVYRRTQQVPFPAQGDGELLGKVLRAQDRLFGLLAQHISTYGAPVFGKEPDLTVIRGATLILIAAVEQFCGKPAAAFVSGQDGSVAA
jgi:hypothetical protein